METVDGRTEDDEKTKKTNDVHTDPIKSTTTVDNEDNLTKNIHLQEQVIKKLAPGDEHSSNTFTKLLIQTNLN